MNFEYKVAGALLVDLEKTLNMYAKAYWKAISIVLTEETYIITFERGYNEEARMLLNEKVETV